MRIDVLGVGFDNLTMQEAVARGAELLEQEGCHYVVTPNPGDRGDLPGEPGGPGRCQRGGPGAAGRCGRHLRAPGSWARL